MINYLDWEQEFIIAIAIYDPARHEKTGLMYTKYIDSIDSIDI